MRKVVIIHANGLRRIIGEFNPEEHEAYSTIELPDWSHTVGPRAARAALVEVGPKSIVYRELVDG